VTVGGSNREYFQARKVGASGSRRPSLANVEIIKGSEEDNYTVPFEKACSLREARKKIGVAKSGGNGTRGIRRKKDNPFCAEIFSEGRSKQARTRKKNGSQSSEKALQTVTTNVGAPGQ